MAKCLNTLSLDGRVHMFTSLHWSNTHGYSTWLTEWTWIYLGQTIWCLLRIIWLSRVLFVLTSKMSASFNNYQDVCLGFLDFVYPLWRQCGILSALYVHLQGLLSALKGTQMLAGACMWTTVRKRENYSICTKIEDVLASREVNIFF